MERMDTLTQIQSKREDAFHLTDDFHSRSSGETPDSMAYMQAVSFAPDSTTRKNHIAVVGYNPNYGGNGKVLTWVIDADTRKRVSNIVVLCNADWMNNLEQYESMNFLDITAGKYDAGEIGESVVIYAAGQGNTPRLWELRYDVSSEKFYFETTATRGNFLNPKCNSSSNDVNNKLTCDMATGDFNGDGADDLAVISYLTQADNPGNYNPDAFVPYFAVTYGKAVGQGNTNGYDRILGNSPKTSYARNVNKQSDGTYKFDSVYAPGLAAGDIDGDGYDEIVMAGLDGYVISDEGNQSSSDGDGMDKDRIDLNKFKVIVYEDDARGFERSVFATVDSNEWTKGGFYDNDDVGTQFQIACVAINGQTAAEHLFIGGSLYSINGGNVSKVYTPSYFNDDDNGANSDSITNTFIQSVVAGNFDANDMGREQLAFTLGLKESGASDYYYKAGMLGGKDYKLSNGSAENPDKGQFGTAKAYYSTNVDKSDYLIENKGDGEKQRLTCLFVEVDTDNDGTVAKYRGHGYVYSDPQVLAVLQAAPYFGELGGEAGGTSYAVSHTYTSGSSEGSTSSWSVGVTLEATVGPVRMGLEAQYIGAMTKSFEKSTSTTYGMQFNATDKDSVVLVRTPFDVYSYDIWTDEGGWKTNALCYQVPRSPSTIQMSVEEYNIFDDYYNSCLDKAYDNPVPDVL